VVVYVNAVADADGVESNGRHYGSSDWIMVASDSESDSVSVHDHVHDTSYEDDGRPSGIGS
jgi:hypothetical protein